MPEQIESLEIPIEDNGECFVSQLHPPILSPKEEKIIREPGWYYEAETDMIVLADGTRLTIDEFFPEK